jgi:P pilus assembly chaperone PapD
MKKLHLTILMYTATLICSTSFLAKSQSFKVTPASIDFSLNIGESDNQTITVENTSDKVESFVVSASDYDFDDAGKMKFMPLGTSKRSCSSYMTITPSFLTLNPNESVKVNVLMKVPQDSMKTRWGIVSIRSEKEYIGIAADKDVVRAGLIITPEIAVKILQTPPSLTFSKMTIKELKETERGKDDSTRVFMVKIANVGEVRTKSKVYLTASNLETLKETTTVPIEVTTLPGVNSEVKLSLPKELKSGNYSLAAILDYGAENDLEGMEMEIKVTADIPKSETISQERKAGQKL